MITEAELRERLTDAHFSRFLALTKPPAPAHLSHVTPSHLKVGFLDGMIQAYLECYSLEQAQQDELNTQLKQEGFNRLPTGIQQTAERLANSYGLHSPLYL